MVLLVACDNGSAVENRKSRVARRTDPIMARNGIPVVDGGSHVRDWEALLPYMPEPYIKSGRFKDRIFPPLDHLHFGEFVSELVPGAFCQVREDGWQDVGIERAVLYVTGVPPLEKSSPANSLSTRRGRGITPTAKPPPMAVQKIEVLPCAEIDLKVAKISPLPWRSPEREERSCVWDTAEVLCGEHGGAAKLSS